MRFEVQDSVELNKDSLGLKKGTRGVVTQVNDEDGLGNYFVKFEGKAQDVLVEDADLV